MVAFIRGGEAFLSRGQVGVSCCRTGTRFGSRTQRTSKYGPVFTPDGARIVYTQVSQDGARMAFDTWTVPALAGEPGGSCSMPRA